MPCCFSIDIWRQIKLLFENFAEIAHAFKTSYHGDRRNRFICRLQEAFSSVHAVFVQIFDWRRVKSVFKDVYKRQILRCMPFAILVWNEEGTIINSNDKFEEYFGIKKSEIIGQKATSWSKDVLKEIKVMYDAGYIEARCV